MDDIKILEAVEKYINGEMRPDERVYFENLRKSSPEIDQLVVEHTFFLQQMNRFDETKKLKNILSDVHIGLAEKGAIKFPKLKGKAKVVYLVNKYKRVAAIAASIAGLTALVISALMWSISPTKQNKELEYLDGQIKAIKNQSNKQQQEINKVKDYIATPAQRIVYKTGGTGFLINSKGLVATNAHVVKDAAHIAIQNKDGDDLKVSLIYLDIAKDIAILKIDDTAFKAPSTLPYAIKQTSSEISEPIYTLGYPRNDIVYGEGYLAAKTGFDGDTLSCQISIAANRGNSGSPILNKNGEVIGILSAKQTTAEGAVFALKSRYIFNALTELKKQDTTYKNIKLPTNSSLKGADRTKQVEKISDFVYIVKVD